MLPKKKVKKRNYKTFQNLYKTVKQIQSSKRNKFLDIMYENYRYRVRQTSEQLKQRISFEYLNRQKQNQQNSKDQLYDVCHHCKRVVIAGTLISHLKNQCLPRRKRILQFHQFTNQRFTSLPSSEENIALSSLNNPEQELNNVEYQKFGGLQEIKHKILSPWTSGLARQIRNQILPTRSILVYNCEN